MTVRRGRSEWLSDSDYRPIEVLLHAEELARCRHTTDVLRILDPDRCASVLGITRDADFDGESITAWGEKLWTNGDLGADLLVVPPHSGFPPHVHPGHHLLLCLAGAGTFSVDRLTYHALPGEMHMIEGGVPHAVANPNDLPHVLIAFGAPPRELDSPDRMRVVEWNGQPLHVPAD